MRKINVWKGEKGIDDKGNLITTRMKETEIELDEKAFDENGKIDEKSLEQLNKKGIIHFDDFIL